ncbi:MAG: penicillin-binding transpeptidase domain-containing protein [Clostridiales bacterium]|nr:penicillin-binding transpeptidase domain-containing protein [Clostridiales bacterium]
MKKLVIIILLCVTLTGCRSKKQSESFSDGAPTIIEENEESKVSGENKKSKAFEKNEGINTLEDNHDTKILEGSSQDNLCDKNFETEKEFVNEDYSDLFRNFNGCAVVYDFETDKYIVYNKKIAEKLYSPYSTFKIVSTLIGLKNDVITDENSKMNYNGATYPIDEWNHDLSLREAFNSSCIWYFRQVIDEVGINEVQEELDSLAYGNCDISQWNGSNINPRDELNGFWLGSSLKISPMEQVQVIKKIFGGDSIYTEKEIGILRDVMLYDEVNGYSIYGKTGTNQNKEGWYVGIAEKDTQKYCFAVFMESEESSQPATGSRARDIVTSIFLTYE